MYKAFQYKVNLQFIFFNLIIYFLNTIIKDTIFKRKR